MNIEERIDHVKCAKVAHFNVVVFDYWAYVCDNSNETCHGTDCKHWDWMNKKKSDESRKQYSLNRIMWIYKVELFLLLFLLVHQRLLQLNGKGHSGDGGINSHQTPIYANHHNCLHGSWFSFRSHTFIHSFIHPFDNYYFIRFVSLTFSTFASVAIIILLGLIMMMMTIAYSISVWMCISHSLAHSPFFPAISTFTLIIITRLH